MSNESSDNPVVLWGDLGPNVYRLSQIYNPKNDRYVHSQDITVQSDKDYYERLPLQVTADTVVNPLRKYFKRIVEDSGRVTFVEVTGSELTGKNPHTEGWFVDSAGKVFAFSYISSPEGNPYEKNYFEVNEDSREQSGKFVPAVDSLVIVDDVICDYKTDNDYKTRMLLSVKSVDPELNVTFVMMEFGTDIEESARSIDYGNEKFMLYFDRQTIESRRTVLLRPYRKLMLYGNHSYMYRLKRGGEVISSSTNLLTEKNDRLIPYIRAIGKRVTIKEDNLEDIKTSGQYIDLVQTSSGQITSMECASLTEDNIGQVGYVFSTPSEVLSNVYIPDNCWLKPSQSITSGELIQMEVFEIKETDEGEKTASLIMTVELTAKETSALECQDLTTRAIVNFDVKLNGEEITSDIWRIQQGYPFDEYTVTPYVTYDDGSQQIVPVDNMSCFMYGKENVSTTVAGREFTLLFKFFPNKKLNIDWDKIGATPTHDCIMCKKKIRVINNLTEQVRKISMIPAWCHVEQSYYYMFLIYTQDMSRPGLAGDVQSHSVVTYVETKDTTLVEGKDYYTKSGDNFIKFEGSAFEPGVKYYERVESSIVGLDDIKYRSPGGGLLPIDEKTSGGFFDRLQFAKISYRVPSKTGDHMESTYTQDIVFKLMNNSNPGEGDDALKWLIAENDQWDRICPYGSDTPYPRPFINRTDDPESEPGTGLFQIPIEVFSDVNVFLNAFYYNGQPPAMQKMSDGSTEFLRPTHFYIRSIADPSVCSQMIKIDHTLGTDSAYPYADPFRMVGGGYAAHDSERIIGGTIPSVVVDNGGHEFKVMGTVILEFTYLMEGTTNEFKYLYGVPVEVRDPSW